MKYIKISRSDAEGGYILPPQEVSGIIVQELNDIDYLAPGTHIGLQVIEMSEEEFKNLPEFDGW
jgi:hypothetical protein